MSAGISLVVLSYERKDCLRELLQHLRGIAPHLLEIVVVDNASTDGTDEMVRAEFPDVGFLRNDTNLGACGRTRGMELARGELIITLDDDVFGLEQSDLLRIQEIFAADPKLAVLNFRVLDYYSGEVCNWVHHCPADRALTRFATYEITEGAVAIRRAALAQVGGYWEKFFIGHEGPDLAFRMMDAGFAVAYDGSIAVRHRHESQGRASWRFYYYDTRNQIWLAARRLHLRQAIRYLGVGLPAMAVYSLRDGFLLWWLRGVKDALKELRFVWSTRSPMQPHTRALVREIDKDRPNFWSLAFKRLRQPANRLDA